MLLERVSLMLFKQYTARQGRSVELTKATLAIRSTRPCGRMSRVKKVIEWDRGFRVQWSWQAKHIPV